MDISNHPCFNGKARSSYGRVHLPVAPRCNIQCKFCNRQYDCVAESRPGVTSTILSPGQARAYLNDLLVQQPEIAVVGIAGPGDPFANTAQTLETLRLVRSHFPDLLLCVATNGLELSSCVDELVALEVSHVTVTINAVDPAVAAKLYSWVRYKKRMYRGLNAARLLLAQQRRALQALCETSIITKVNTVVVPGINDHHVSEISAVLRQLGVDAQNCIPHHPVPGTPFAGRQKPGQELMNKIRNQAADHLKQMSHCMRCRADAAGLLDVSCSTHNVISIEHYAKLNRDPSQHRPYVAAVSNEGVLVNQHLGEAHEFLVFRWDPDNGKMLVDRRPAPAPGGGPRRWSAVAELLRDCSALLVGDAGPNPTSVLTASGLKVWRLQGMLQDVVPAALQGQDLTPYEKVDKFVCGAGCSGGGMGCL